MLKTQTQIKTTPINKRQFLKNIIEYSIIDEDAWIWYASNESALELLGKVRKIKIDEWHGRRVYINRHVTYWNIVYGVAKVTLPRTESEPFIKIKPLSKTAIVLYYINLRYYMYIFNGFNDGRVELYELKPRNKKEDIELYHMVEGAYEYYADMTGHYDLDHLDHINSSLVLYWKNSKEKQLQESFDIAGNRGTRGILEWLELLNKQGANAVIEKYLPLKMIPTY